jgi:hypothetical protein
MVSKTIEKQIKPVAHRSVNVTAWYRLANQSRNLLAVIALIKDIETFIERHNADPKPLHWTKSADDILASIERFCRRTLDVYAPAV